MTLRHDGISWSLSGSRADILPAQAGHAPHKRLQTVCGPAHQAARNWLGTRIGQADTPLQSYFAQVAPCNIMRLVAAAQAHHVRSRLASTSLADLPILSATAPFRAGGRGGAANFTDIPAGPLELRHATDIYPFPNTVVALLLTGAEIADWLERAVIQFMTLSPDKPDQPMVNPDSPSFDFDLIAGLTFRIDPSRPPRFDSRGDCIHPESRRISAISLHGQPLSTKDRFILATNSYRAAGSGGFPGCWPDRILLDDKTSTRAALVAFLAQEDGSARPAWYDWSFAPIGTSATFDTAARATAHASHIANLNPEPITGAALGYQRFRLHL